MNVSAPFINRPVATTLLTVAVVLAGAMAFRTLPVSPLPQVDFPTISVSASLPGASPETMAATVATPLERALGRIAGVTELTSSSGLGSTRVVLQFDLSRDIDGAARDVQAALNAARTLLPSGLPSNPTYRKVNPADAPIMILALTSATRTQGQMYDAASTILAQKLSQVQGVGQVTVGGSSLPAVRVELNPQALFKYGIGPEDVRAAITATNVNRPKGTLEQGERHWQILANDQAVKAAEYLPIVVSYRNDAPVRLSDVAEVTDSVQDLRNAGSANGKPSVLAIIYRQPNANIIETVDRVKALLPVLRASIPSAIDLDLVLDRTPTIRGSLRDTERTLMMAIFLVILVVFLFLRDWRATLIPSVAVPVSLIGTFGVMYLCNYSLNNLSLMALIVATGFVVDDAIVVLENISRRVEKGESARAAALAGAKEVGFTVLSMSLSLIAVFIPILLMGGIVGRLFREFAVVLSVAILISLLVSLTTTPMMCAWLLKPAAPGPGAAAAPRGRLYRWSERGFAWLLHGYEVTLAWGLRHKPLTLLLLALTIAFNFHLYAVVPKGFFPQQDTGRLIGGIQADQGISFQAMRGKLAEFIDLVRRDPAVVNVVGFSGGGGGRNTGFMFVTLKPVAERKLSADRVVARLRQSISKVAGASLFLVPVQDIRIGGRQANAQYQFTLLADELEELRDWGPRVRAALADLPELVDVNTDQQDKGLQTSLVIDRDTASRLGVTTRMIDSTLNDVFGQRIVSTIYNPLNQYRVVMEAAPQYWQNPETLKSVYVASTAGATPGAQVPLSAFSRYETSNTPLSVQHQGQFAATTISFNLPPGVALSTATDAVRAAMDRIGVPTGIYGTFQGTARAFQASLDSQPFLILAALIAVYLVLGMLYESLVHPVTILSTLPSAGVGAILALLLSGSELNIISLIGVILLIGIVKKNAIMMIDFAVDAQRARGLAPEQAIYEACLIRFRPIMMTTMAALLSAVPLAIGFGEGAELRRPLGIAIVGGLLVSQVLTLYSTPVVYVYLDRFRLWISGLRGFRSKVLAVK
jgi:multidrug efflux pump